MLESVLWLTCWGSDRMLVLWFRVFLCLMLCTLTCCSICQPTLGWCCVLHAKSGHWLVWLAGWSATEWFCCLSIIGHRCCSLEAELLKKLCRPGLNKQGVQDVLSFDFHLWRKSQDCWLGSSVKSLQEKIELYTCSTVHFWKSTQTCFCCWLDYWLWLISLPMGCTVWFFPCCLCINREVRHPG